MTIFPHFDSPVLKKVVKDDGVDHAEFLNEVINDFWISLVSRETSLLGRREVLTGKAKFGIFGDGKELPQIALAKCVKDGDYRAGYYRDQTLMMALGISSVGDFLSQMYSDTVHDPFSGGRQMNAHFATPFIDVDGDWINQSSQINISSGVSCTAGQVGRALGLAFASKKLRELELNSGFDKFFQEDQEICICTIGDASTSEGAFWETVNAAVVLKVPLLIAVWDDGYGISVPVDKQTAKGSISSALEGFRREGDGPGIDLYEVEGWDYTSLCVTFDKAVSKVRSDCIPAVVHVKNLTQPQGHSTSGSHERYKSKQRLAWEKEYDCIHQFEEWILNNEILDEDEIYDMKREARAYVRERRAEAWDRFKEVSAILNKSLKEIYKNLPDEIGQNPRIIALSKELEDHVHVARSELLSNARQLKYALMANQSDVPDALNEWIDGVSKNLKSSYASHLYSETAQAAVKVPVIHPEYSDESKMVNGYQVLNTYFDRAFEKYPELIAFGEDVGQIGDVNQGMAGMQKKHGAARVFDTGIREWTIIGQGLGCAMRGLRPIAEIQYLDYLVYAMPVITDDLATLRYRSNNQQKAPMIIRTRGHRLEGIWHTGSPISLLLSSMRGIYILTPRNMVQAAGMYATMMRSDDPAIMIECLNGYRLKEKLPDNIGEYTVPLGRPEVIHEGNDVTLVTYGSCVRVAAHGVKLAMDFGISVELIDAQTLIPFDLEFIILESLKKTNKIIFLDEDVPGGTTAYMMQKVLEEQGGYQYLDGMPRTISAKDHRTPYGSDGDYYAKPQAEDVFEAIYEVVLERPFQ